MLAFLTDWNEEIIFRTPTLSNDAHGITSERGLESNIINNSKEATVSNFVTTSVIDNNMYRYLNNIYDDKVNYNFMTTESNFAWWSGL